MHADTNQIFSALYSILPSSKKYLIKDGFTPKAAAWVLLAGLVGGFVVIRLIIRIAHEYMPSHEIAHLSRSRCPSIASQPRNRRSLKQEQANGKALEATPLLDPTFENGRTTKHYKRHVHMDGALSYDGTATSRQSKIPKYQERRPSMLQVKNKVMSFIKDTKSNCESSGPCYGYTDPCGQDYFTSSDFNPSIGFHRPNAARALSTGNIHHHHHCHVPAGPLNEESTRLPSDPTQDTPARMTSASTASQGGSSESLNATSQFTGEEDDEDENAVDCEELEPQGHHHQGQNAFGNISIQTSIAIALHKLPEGFMTYATNHANPDLGLNVFMALFVHNITEGFVLAFPLYLTLGSRMQAMFWASLLGGLSQPIGAGIAALWFGVAGREGNQPGSGVYGIMFAVTAGIMASVALELFTEGMKQHPSERIRPSHKKHEVCIVFAFLGMAIVGASNALTA